ERVSVERFFRDSRINTIFEGSSEIMRLFIAREALDPHLKIAGPVLNSRLPLTERLRAALKAAGFYLGWYLKQVLPRFNFQRSTFNVPPVLRRHLRYAARTSRKLARRLFHAMLVHGPKLERQQVLLGRFVDIGTEVFAITAACARAAALIARGGNAEEWLSLVERFCRSSRLRRAPSLSPFDGETVAEGRVRGGSWSPCVRNSESGLSMNRPAPGPPRRGTRQACPTLAPLFRRGWGWVHGPDLRAHLEVFALYD